MKANYFATIRKGRIIGACYAYPAQELKRNDVPITYAEYHFLSKMLPYKFDEMKKLVVSIQRKINKVK